LAVWKNLLSVYIQEISLKLHSTQYNVLSKAFKIVEMSTDPKVKLGF